MLHIKLQGDNNLRKHILFTFLLISIFIILVGCSTSKKTVFSEKIAILEVVKKHPEFPSEVGSREIKVEIGGIEGNKTSVKLETKIEQKGNNEYVVTLTKMWGIRIANIIPVSYWKYNVTPNKTTLIESKDNDDMVKIIK